MTFTDVICNVLLYLIILNLLRGISTSQWSCLIQSQFADVYKVIISDVFSLGKKFSEDIWMKSVHAVDHVLMLRRIFVEQFLTCPPQKSKSNVTDNCGTQSLDYGKWSMMFRFVSLRWDWLRMYFIRKGAEHYTNVYLIRLKQRWLSSVWTFIGSCSPSYCVPEIKFFLRFVFRPLSYGSSGLVFEGLHLELKLGEDVLEYFGLRHRWKL